MGRELLQLCYSFLGYPLGALLELEDSPSLAGAGGVGSWRLSVGRQVDWEPEP